MSSRHFNEIFGLLVCVLPIMHKKIHRDVFKMTIEKSGEDMAPHHLMILKMLRESGPLSMSEISEEVVISRSQMTHSTDKLIKLGMIERQGDARDRRKVHIKLTHKGKEYLKMLDPIMRSRMESKLSVLTDKDMIRLAISLRDVAGIFTKLHWE
ncbi:MAG: MarR family transcriptional regulator [Dehalococcoidales bacterium]|nr:MarR family transcriptional regulator [Dehalococcoidales bacterium]